MKEKIHRVFFHELGHFVAREINYLKYGGPIPIEIKIYPCPEDDSEMCGGTTPKRPEGMKVGQPIPPERLPSYLVSLIYGCIFQCYYNQTKLVKCLKMHGVTDVKKIAETLLFCKKIGLNQELAQIDESYFEYIISQKVLEPFMNLDIESYLIPLGDDHFNVNIEKLRQDTEGMIKEYIPFYDNIVYKYDQVISQD